jgi:phage protein U
MHHAQVYSDKFIQRARKHREAGNNREDTVALLGQEFPEFVGRITPKSLTDLLSRAAYRKARQTAGGQKQTKRTTHWVELDAETKQEVYAGARRYHDQRWRWSAIMEALAKDYPDVVFPPVGVFSHWVLAKTTSGEVVKPPTPNRNNFTLTITNCGSIQFEKSIDSLEAKRIILTALGVM